MTNWEQPHWSGRPQPGPEQPVRLKPNVFARLARFSLNNAGLIIFMALFLSAMAAGLAAFSIRILPAAQPVISLDEQTAKAEARLEAAFPGIDRTFFATIENASPAYARDSAMRVGDELRRRGGLFKTVIVPGTGPFYDKYGLLFLPAEEVNTRVARMLQMQPLYHALGAAPSLAGLGALVGEISKTVAQGRSPPGLENLLLAIAAAVEGEVKGKPSPVDWPVLAGLKQANDSRRWFIIAEPVAGQEMAAADAATTIASRIPGLKWSFPPHTFDGRPANLSRDLAIPALLSLFAVTVILLAGLGSLRQSIAVLGSGLAALAFSAGLASAVSPTFDAVTWSIVAAVLAPGFLLSLNFVIPYGQARAHGKSAASSIMLAAHRSGARLLIYAALAEVLWLTWLPRQIDSLSLLAIIVSSGIAVAALLALTLVPAILGFGQSDSEEGSFHWLDDALAIPASSNLRNARALAALVVMAASVFCTIFVANVEFGDPQFRETGTDTFDTPAAIGAVHLLAKPEDAAGLIERVGNVPEVGAIRWIEQFMPRDVDAKLNALRSLADLLPGVSGLVPPAEGQVTPELLGGLEKDLQDIANNPSTADGLREAAHRLRRAFDLFMAPGILALPRIAALERSIFGNLDSLTREADRLAALQPPAISGLDDDLRRHFVSSDGYWRFEILPKPEAVGFAFAAAMRKLTPQAAGVPIVALARSEIMHHEAILAILPALAIGGVIALATVRRLSRAVVALVPTPMALALSAAALVASGRPVDAAALAALSTAIAASFAASLTLALGQTPQAGESEPEMDISFRSAILPLAAALAAVAPLIVSGSPAIAGFAHVAGIFLFTAILCNALIGVQLLAWVKEALGPEGPG